MKKKTKKKLLLFDGASIFLLVCVLLLHVFSTDQDRPYDKMESQLKMSKEEVIIKPLHSMVDSMLKLNNETQSVQSEQEKEGVQTDRDIHISVVGDVLLSSSPLNKYDQTNKIQSILSEDLLSQMNRDDVTFANVEFPFSLRGSQMPDKQYTFRTDPKRVSILNEMGMDLATLANNHILDYGIEALLDTITTLNEAGIKNIGAGENLEEAKKSACITLKGRKFAFLAASRVIPVYEWNATSTRPGVFTTYDPAMLCDEIREAKKTNDFVIVYVHWGIEHKDHPEQYQRVMGKQYIDAGADIVIGSHTHMLQGIEYYNGKPIIYSLGNFIFGHTIDKTLMLDIIIDKNNSVRLRVIPCKAEEAYTQAITENKVKKQFYKYYESISYNIKIDSEGYVSNY